MSKRTSQRVTREKFDEFIEEYPNALEVDVAHMFEPPLKTYNDFTDDKVWPKSSVAFVKLYDGSEYHSGMSEEYYIFTTSK